MKSNTSAGILGFLILLGSCGIIALPGPEGVSYTPSEADSILPRGGEIAVWFDFEVDRLSAERVIRILGIPASPRVRYEWDGNRVTLVPESLVYGRRYALEAMGTVHDRDGHTHELSIYVPFFYQAVVEQGFSLEASSPSPGSVITTSQVLTLGFTAAVDPTTLREGLTLSSGGEWTETWSADSRVLTITTPGGWKNAATLTLTVADRLRDTAGRPARPTNLSWRVEEAAVAPEVTETRVVPNDPLASFGPAVSHDLNTMGVRDALLIAFSKPMDRSTTESALTIRPPITGRFHWLDARTLVFAPSQSLSPEIRYTLTLDTTAEDSTGLAMALPYEESFTVATPHLAVQSLSVPQAAGTAVVLPPFGGNLMIPFQPTFDGLTYTALISIVFSAPLPVAERPAIQAALSFQALLPTSAGSPLLISVGWPSQTSVNLLYGNLRPTAPGTRTLYRFTIRGGPSGIRDIDGSWLREDLSFHLETE